MKAIKFTQQEEGAMTAIKLTAVPSEDFFAEEERRLLAESRAEIEAEDSAWRDLTPQQKKEFLDAKDAKREAERVRQERITAQYRAEHGDEEDDESEEA